MDFEKKECPIVGVDGFIEKGKEFDIEINMPEDNRGVIYGIIRDCFSEPVDDAVVALVEVSHEHGKKERMPVSHTFTDDHGEFLFGPLCPDKSYEILFWANKVKHVKICANPVRKGKCLKGVKLDCPKDFKPECGREEEDNCPELFG